MLSMSCRIESGCGALSHPLLPDIGTAPAIADAVFHCSVRKPASFRRWSRDERGTFKIVIM